MNMINQKQRETTTYVLYNHINKLRYICILYNINILRDTVVVTFSNAYFTRLLAYHPKSCLLTYCISRCLCLWKEKQSECRGDSRV